MKGEFLLLFVILLLGLILCSFLGGKGCVKEGMDNQSGQTFYGPKGTTAQVQTDDSGNNSLVITNSDGTTSTYSSSSSTSSTSSGSTTYTGPNGGTAQVQTDANGATNLIVTNPDGTTHTYSLNDTSSSSNSNSNSSQSSGSSSNANSNANANYDNYNHYDGTSYPTIFYGPDGGTARVIQTSNDNTLVITNKNGTTDIYYINKKSDPSVKSYYGPNGGSAKIVTDNNGKQAVEITTPDGSKILYYSDNVYVQKSQDSTMNQYNPDTNSKGADYNNAFTGSSYYGPNGGNVSTITGPSGNTYSTYDSSAYSNSLPQGIPRNMIPSGQEDLYILKSEVVPPVCPKCPDPIVLSSDDDVTKCPPCPPCARCPEPQFDCKKVPNYNAFNPNTMPVPVLNDFSSFGM